RCVGSPRADDGLRLTRGPGQGTVVGRTDRVGCLEEVERLGRAVAVQVDDHDPAGLLALSEAHAAADRRVIHLGVGRRRVQHDERERLLPRVPDTAQSVAVLTALTQLGVVLDVVHLHSSRACASLKPALTNSRYCARLSCALSAAYSIITGMVRLSCSTAAISLSRSTLGTSV